MMNQAAVEALYSATFAEDYLDVVENMPNEMQRHLSRLREADLAQYREFWCDLDKLVDSFESETTLSGQRQILDKIKKGLILTQDMGDEKLAVMTGGNFVLLPLIFSIYTYAKLLHFLFGLSTFPYAREY